MFNIYNKNVCVCVCVLQRAITSTLSLYKQNQL